MMMTRWLASVLAVLSCLAPAIVRAADTGSISGVVFDQGGQLVEAATVRLTGEPLPGERVATTDANGAYRFPLLLPGAYTLEVTKQGSGTSKRAVTVQVDVDTQVDIVLGLNLDETDRSERGRSCRRPQDHRGQLQLRRAADQGAAAAADVCRAVPADSRCRREQQRDGGHGQRRRQPAGQHLPDRRRQHHQPRLRLPEHRGQRVRHRRVQRQARRDLRRVRPVVRLRHQRRHALGYQPVQGRRPVRGHSRSR